ncbi:MAG: helix-turn-helix domain-containing protein [Candidatus Puniceispirillum sp.]|nr:helix-turn-helix domain-containing protein [Candidatus Puniceispirillum sp.]
MVANDSFEKIGSTLKSARRSQRFKIRDVSQQLRISVDYLSYLENGAFDELPAPAYVTGFLRSYGQFLGLDPVPLVSRYAALSAEKTVTPKYKMPMRAGPPQRSAPAIVSMLLVFAGIGYGSWYWLIGTDQAEQIAMAPTEIASGVFSVGNDVRVVTSTATAANPALPADRGPTKTAAIAANTTDPTLASDLAPAGDLAAVVIASSSADLGGNAAIANLRDPAQEITIRAIAASWVEIIRDNGEEVTAKLMQAGDSQVIEGNERLYLSTGNAGGLMIKVGSDEPRSLGEVGEIVRDLPLVTDKLREVL